MNNEATKLETSTEASGRVDLLVGGDDATRASFEIWMSDDGESPNAVERGGNENPDGYKLMQAQSAWGTWKACARTLGIKWHRYPDNTPVAIGSYLVVKSADGIREIEWAFFNSSNQWLSTTGFFIDGAVTHFSKLPKLPAR